MKKFFVAFIAVVVLYNAGFGIFLRPLLYTLTPLQRYYLEPYLASSWHEKNPTATTEIQLIWKVRSEVGSKKGEPKIYSALATEDDLFPVPARELLWKSDLMPFLMTRKAELDGWSGIEQGRRIEVNSAKLALLLRQEFFAGEPAWRFFVQPAMILGVAMLFGSLLWSWRKALRRRYLWTKPVPLWRELGQRILASGAGVRKDFLARRTKLDVSKVTLERVIEAIPTAQKPAPHVPVAPARPASPKKTATVPTSLPLGNPSLNGKPKEGFAWDETKGIE